MVDKTPLRTAQCSFIPDVVYGAIKATSTGGPVTTSGLPPLLTGLAPVMSSSPDPYIVLAAELTADGKAKAIMELAGQQIRH